MDFGANYVNIDPYESCLDGYFTIEQLKEVIRIMELEQKWEHEYAELEEEQNKEGLEALQDKENN